MFTLFLFNENQQIQIKIPVNNIRVTVNHNFLFYLPIVVIFKDMIFHLHLN